MPWGVWDCQGTHLPRISFTGQHTCLQYLFGQRRGPGSATRVGPDPEGEDLGLQEAGAGRVPCSLVRSRQ